MTDKPSLTLAALRTLQPGQELWDHVVTGLHARRRSTITTWNLYYRAHNGTKRNLKLGEWPALTVELVRDAARELLVRVAKGEDPAADKKAAREAPTVSELCDEWLERKKPPVKKVSSYKLDTYNITNHVRPRLGALKVAAVTSKDVRDAIEAIERGWDEPTKKKDGTPSEHKVRRGGATAARVVRTLVSGLFTLAEHSELKWRPPHTNPVSEVPEPAGTKAKRRVHIQRESFVRLAAALEDLRPKWPEHVACIWIILYCGTRITELATVEWSSLIGSSFVLDRHKTDRSGEPRTIRLSNPALEELAKLSRQGRYVFPTLAAMNKQDKDGARRSVHYVFDLARDAAGCPEIRPQDLRRTFASVGASLKFSLKQIGDLFDHGNPATTARYAHLFEDVAQGAAEDIGQEIATLAGKREAATLRTWSVELLGIFTRDVKRVEADALTEQEVRAACAAEFPTYRVHKIEVKTPANTTP